MPSTAVEWAQWNEGVLSVKYRGGDAYDYFDVPERVYRDYKAATSKGQFVNFVIKPNYRYRRRPSSSRRHA
jgi:hypothetical protein